MTQIKYSQIIPSRKVEMNPSVSPPRDLQVNADQLPSTRIPAAGTSISPPAAGDLPQHNSIINNDIPNAVIIPEVPVILGIAQTVTMTADGTSKIDIIITLKDIPGINEFDIRVAKNAGNL